MDREGKHSLWTSTNPSSTNDDSEESTLNSIEFAQQRDKQRDVASDRSDSRSKSVETVRLNPAVVKKKGLKLLREEDNNNTVLDLYGNLSTSGLSPVDDTDLRKNKDGLHIKEDLQMHNSKRMLKDLFTEPGDTCWGAWSGHLNRLQTRERHKMPPKKVAWWQVTLYLLNDIHSSWLILYSAIIPGLYGWILGLTLLVALWPLNMYVAHILWRCRNVFPGAISIGDLVYYLTKSSWAMYTTFFFVNFTILLNFAYSVFMTSSNVYWMTGLTKGHCGILFLGGVCLLLYPVTQLRTLHSLTIINITNLVAMFCFVGVFLYFLVENGREKDVVTHIGPNTAALKNSLDRNARLQKSPIIGLDIMLVAFEYQLLILEIMAEMKTPSDFPKANYWSAPVVIFITLSCASFRYYYEGDLSLTLKLPNEIVTSVFDGNKNELAYFGMICFTIQMFGSCLIRSVILTRSIQLLVHPELANARTWYSRFEWAGISFSVLALAWLLSLVIAMQGFMTTLSGLLAICVAMVLPLALYIKCKRETKQLKVIPWFEWMLMGAVFLASTCMLCVYVLKIIWRTTDGEFVSEVHNFTTVEFDEMTDCSISGF